MKGGINNYIDGLSNDSHIRAKQLWQLLCGKILFIMTVTSSGNYICKKCWNHTLIFNPNFNFNMCRPIDNKLLTLPVDIVNDGYDINMKNYNKYKKLKINNFF